MNVCRFYKKISSLKFNVDFFAGYSPVRINSGDKEYTVEKILKVTSGSTPEIGHLVNKLYNCGYAFGTLDKCGRSLQSNRKLPT